MQLGRLRLSGTGHAGEVVVQAEVILKRNRRQGLVLGLDLYAFFGLDGLVHALVVAAARQHTAGELVDNKDLAIADDVVLIANKEFLRLNGVVQISH